MDENRINAYYQLIQKLLQCPSEKEQQILNAHFDLFDPGLLATIAIVAQQFYANGNQNDYNFLTNLALQLGEWLGKDQQPTAIRKETADILLQWGFDQFKISQFEVASQCWQQCLLIYQAIDNRQGEGISLGGLGNAYYSLGQFEQAIGFYEQWLTISQKIKDREGETNSLIGLGSAYRSLGEYERAITFHEDCLAISQQIKNRQGEASSLGNLGLTYNSLGEYERAIALHKKALAISREIKDPQGEASSLGNLGLTYNSLGEYERAIAFYQKCLNISRQIKYLEGEEQSLIGLGDACSSLEEYEQAIAFYEQLLAISREIKNRQWEANSLGNLGIAYDSLGEYERAIALYEQCLVISREIKYPQGEANSMKRLGSAYRSLGEYERAIAFYEKSLALSREIKERQGEADSLAGLGNVYYSLGHYERAVDFYEQSLVIQQSLVTFKEIKDRTISISNLGTACHALGQYERAIASYEKSLALSREIKYRQGEMDSLGGLGNTCYSLGQYEGALNFYEQQLAISREIKNRQGEASSLGHLGIAHQCLGQYERAIALYEESLAIEREIKERQGEASSLGNLGTAYHFLGQSERAMSLFKQSLAISQEIKYRPGEVNALGNLGDAYRELQQTEKAIEHYRDCLKITRTETTITMPAECFKTGRNLGDIGFTQGDWNLALEGYEPALQAVEQLRKGSTTDKRRQEIIAEAISVYANAVQCYINLKQYDKAVETADRSRSRHLADLFASKDLYPKGKIPPEVEEYYRLQQQSDRLRFSENDGTKALGTTRKPTPNDDAIIEKIEAEKQKAWLKIRSKDEVLASQLQPDPLSFKDMQALIPDAETAILNFYTTSEHTHIFILRQNQPTKLYTCEGQGLETLQKWIFDNWLKPYKENEPAWQNQMGEVLHELANRLQMKNLISPYLTDIKELIIIPHLYLHQIPFAALPLNDTPIPQSETPSEQTRAPKNQKPPTKTALKSSQKQPEYLSVRFRIRIVPSCQILNFCHQRGNLKPATMGIVENATGDLLFTGYECETLATMHKVDKNSRLQYQQATISNYQNLLERVQVLHSSHHAASNLNNSLESKLLLFDGDINLGRVFTWRFKDLAEVFLSCCETNLTLTPITDDPLSIASGFLCAGARNVVSTLWAVDDLATALFCILYYQEKQDKSRSDAIREAQFKLRNLTGDELSAKYQGLLDAYFEQQQWGENQTEIVNKVRIRLNVLSREKLPFVSPYNWAGFISQGLA
jgi:tetratricopeptide (TPR) repeat protein/CHAT domain-containing protein